MQFFILYIGSESLVLYYKFKHTHTHTDTYSVVSLSAEHTKQLGFVTRVLKHAEKWDSRDTHSPRCP